MLNMLNSTAADGFNGDDLVLARPAILRHCQLAPRHPLDNLTTLIEAETFQVRLCLKINSCS
jgi:hypothetical protein